MNKYYRALIKDATAANASEQQLDLIKALAGAASEGSQTRYGTNKDVCQDSARSLVDSITGRLQTRPTLAGSS
jgi:hypothetical protein